MKARPSAASIDVRGESRLSRTARGDLRMHETDAADLRISVVSAGACFGARRSLRRKAWRGSRARERARGLGRTADVGERRPLSGSLRSSSFLYGSMLERRGTGSSARAGLHQRERHDGAKRIAAAKSRDRRRPEKGIHRRQALWVASARMSFTGPASKRSRSSVERGQGESQARARTVTTQERRRSRRDAIPWRDESPTRVTIEDGFRGACGVNRVLHRCGCGESHGSADRRTAPGPLL